jgi:hypothetical protein
MRFLHPEYLWLLAALPVFFTVWFMWGRRANTLKDTQLSSRTKLKSGWGTFLTIGIWTAKTTIWVALVLGLMQTSLLYYSFVTESSGLIYFTEDTSGSLSWGVTTPQEIKLAALYNPEFKDGPINKDPANKDPMSSRGMKFPQRVETGLGAIKLFIQHSHGLRIGLTAFDDQFFYLHPATTHEEVILNMLPQIKKYCDTHSTGTNFDGPIPGTSEPYAGALQGAVDVFNAEQETGDNTHIFIMVTDGDSSISEDRAADLKDEFQRLKIHMFVFGIGPDWLADGPSVQPLKNFVKSVGGEIVPVEDVARFEAATDHIDTLAASTVHTRKVEHPQDALLLWLAIAGGAFVLYLVFVALRRSTL